MLSPRPLVLAAVLASGISSARADGPPVDAGCLIGEAIAGAAVFVAEATGTAAPEVCLRRWPQRQLSALVHSSPVPAHAQVAAAYMPRSMEILLADDLDLLDPLARSYLVHELVHAQQIAAGKHRRVACLGRLEEEAYAVQARYLDRHGLGREALLFRLIGMLQGACGVTY